MFLRAKMASFQAANKFFLPFFVLKYLLVLLCASRDGAGQDRQTLFSYGIYILYFSKNIRKASEKGKLWKEKLSVNRRSLINIC